MSPAPSEHETYEKRVELGRLDMQDRANGKVEEILTSPQKNPLDDDVIGKLEDIRAKS